MQEKNSGRINKKVFAIVIVLIAILGAITSSTYAVWQMQAETSIDLELPIAEFNPSEKYLVYYGLNAEGAFSDTDIVSYAVVGYTGLVAEVTVPSEYNGLPVTEIAVHPDYAQMRFAESPVITAMYIPSTVKKITAGACRNMPYLKEVIFYGDTAIILDDYAFAFCGRLEIFDLGARSVSGDRAAYLLGTPVL